MYDIDYDVVYELFENLFIDDETAFDSEDDNQISWVFNYGEDKIHIIVEKSSQLVTFPVLSIVSPIFELDEKEIDSQDKLLEVYEDLLDMNFNLFGMSLAAYDNFVFIVYKLKLDELSVDKLINELKFFISILLSTLIFLGLL